MDIDTNKLDWKSFGALIRSIVPRGGIHPLQAFPVKSRILILQRLHKFADEATGPDGTHFPVKLPPHLHEALEECERMIAEGKDDGSGDLQRSVGEYD